MSLDCVRWGCFPEEIKLDLYRCQKSHRLPIKLKIVYIYMARTTSTDLIFNIVALITSYSFWSQKQVGLMYIYGHSAKVPTRSKPVPTLPSQIGLSPPGIVKNFSNDDQLDAHWAQNKAPSLPVSFIQSSSPSDAALNLTAYYWQAL